MFTIENGFFYDMQEMLLSVVDLANYTGDVTALTFGHGLAALALFFVASVVFSGPKMASYDRHKSNDCRISRTRLTTADKKAMICYEKES